MHDTHLRPSPIAVAYREFRPRHERRAAERRHWRVRSALATLALIALIALTPALTRADGGVAERVPDGAHALDHPGTGTLVLGPSGAGVEALLLDTRLALDVQGLLGELTLTQTFRNTTDRWLDGTYLFPLPADAAVRGLELRVGERRVVGRVQRRDEARATFERARAAGQVAGLVEQQRPNLFTARLASIAPGSEIRIELDVLIPVTAGDDALSLTLPTTLTPRYANAHVTDAARVSGPILAAREIRGPRLALDARIRPLADPSLVTSATHRLETDGTRIVLRDAPMDRDIALAWPYAHGRRPVSEAFVATHHGERYVQLFMAPPARIDDGAVAPRELVLVVDTSGSMAGTSIAAARAAAQSALDGLRASDTFDLIAFDDDTRSLFDGARAATADNVAKARRFVRDLRADGGTEMSSALARALVPPVRVPYRAPDVTRPSEPTARSDDAAAERLRQVVFLTDGSIADEERLLTQIRRDVGFSRLFTVGIGSAPNGWFLDKAAEAGRGVALAIRDVDDVRDAVAALLGRLERPVLTDIEVQFPDGGGESYPARVPDLYADAPLMIVARLAGAGGEAVVTGWRGDERFMRRIALPDPVGTAVTTTTTGTTTGTTAGTETMDAVDASEPTRAADDARVAPALAMHWARAKVTSLLDEQRESRDDERHRERITALALDVGLVTPYTSFVAVEVTPTRPDGVARADAEVANLLPDGNEMTSVAMPQGAAGIDTLGLLGLLCGLLGSVLLWFGRRVDGIGARGIGASSAGSHRADDVSA